MLHRVANMISWHYLTWRFHSPVEKAAKLKNISNKNKFICILYYFFFYINQTIELVETYRWIIGWGAFILTSRENQDVKSAEQEEESK